MTERFTVVDVGSAAKTAMTQHTYSKGRMVEVTGGTGCGIERCGMGIGIKEESCRCKSRTRDTCLGNLWTLLKSLLKLWTHHSTCYYLLCICYNYYFAAINVIHNLVYYCSTNLDSFLYLKDARYNSLIFRVCVQELPCRAFLRNVYHH